MPNTDARSGSQRVQYRVTSRHTDNNRYTLMMKIVNILEKAEKQGVKIPKSQPWIKMNYKQLTGFLGTITQAYNQ